MDALPEVIISTSDSCSVFDSENGNILRTFKYSNIMPKTLALIGEDYIIGAMANKPVLKIWTISKKVKQRSGDMPVPGIVTALTVSNCGMYCAAGIKKDMYIWKVCTGELLTLVPRHFQDITCLRFSSDDSHLLSGGKDGHVNVWVFTRLLDIYTPGDQVKPRYTWSHHSAEVTDIYVGLVGPVARVATTSTDMTCRLYELDSGILISTICMDAPLTAVTLDTLEYYVFIGDTRGVLFRVNTYERLPKELQSNEMKECEFKIHEKKIVSLAVSLEGTKLLSSSEDMSIRLWDIESLSCILRIPVEGNITNTLIVMKPAVLSDDDILPQVFVGHFRRETDSVCRDKNLKKFQETKSNSKPLTLMHVDKPEICYNPALLKLGTLRNLEDGNESNPYVREDKFQEVINGDTIHELTSVNNQMYTYLTTHALENLPGLPASDSE